MDQSGTPVIRRATSHDIEDIARIISRAFATDDPIEEYVFPDPADRHRRSPRMLRIMIRYRFLPAGGAAVSTVDGKVVGALLWYPAGYRKSLWREAISGPLLLAAMGAGTARGVHVDNAIAEVRPVEGHHFMVYLGADPTVQRAGVGRSLVNWLDALADERDETVGGICKDGNMPYYATFGYGLIRRVRIGSTGPEMNFVLRQPVPVP
ncbi:GNAT family N-acetyltransferase [Nocardia sp. NPDC058058]|uniref:GNAT family N-acetyltransferase n=1 Tax=Nocardia sp. NPDC058058 TaxID=3346317 RepID=UPI0036DF19F7